MKGFLKEWSRSTFGNTKEILENISVEIKEFDQIKEADAIPKQDGTL